VIVWLRHGQSTWNATGRMQGHTAHPPLTDLGRQQARAAADELAGLGITTVLSSPAVRARQTATIVAERLGLEVELEPRLVEQGLQESIDDVETRTREVLAELPDDAVPLVVSHGDLIGLAVARATGGVPRIPENGEVQVVGRPGS
jgi:broad specificity phosphatase PhoE